MLISFQVLNTIACIWDLLFISALNEISLAGAFSTWYWTYNKADVPFSVMSMSATRTAVYHSGTAAFGALVLSICRILRLFVEGGSHGNECILCIQCFFICMVEVIKRLTRNAYIMCAIHGKGLCASGVSSCQLVVRNVLRCFTAELATNIIFGGLKLLLALGTGLIGWVYFNNGDCRFTDAVTPLLLLIFCTHLIAGAFFSVFSMAVDTLVLCACK